MAGQGGTSNAALVPPQTLSGSSLSDCKFRSELGAGDRQPRAVRALGLREEMPGGGREDRQGKGQGSNCLLASPAFAVRAPEM